MVFFRAFWAFLGQKTLSLHKKLRNITSIKSDFLTRF